MLTNNYGFDLMIPSQANKDVVFNEAITKLDSFCNFSIDSFENNVPHMLNPGSMHIICDGTYAMSICYCPSEAAGWKIQKPKKGMVFFVRSENKLFYFDGRKWDAVATSSAVALSTPGSVSSGDEFVAPKTTGLAGHVNVPAGQSKMWLYMSGDGKLDLGSATTNMLTIIIKQNYQKPCNIEFIGNILWKDKKHFQLSQKPNVFDIIRFHKISETDHWIPEVVGQGFEY